MQYNDYLEDPLSAGNPANAISSRYDLRTNNPAAFGGIDSKVYYLIYSCMEYSKNFL